MNGQEANDERKRDQGPSSLKSNDVVGERGLEGSREWGHYYLNKTSEKERSRESNKPQGHGSDILAIEPGAEIVVDDDGKVEEGLELAHGEELARVLGQEHLLHVVLLVVLAGTLVRCECVLSLNLNM